MTTKIFGNKATLTNKNLDSINLLGHSLGRDFKMLNDDKEKSKGIINEVDVNQLEQFSPLSKENLTSFNSFGHSLSRDIDTFNEDEHSSKAYTKDINQIEYTSFNSFGHSLSHEINLNLEHSEDHNEKKTTRTNPLIQNKLKVTRITNDYNQSINTHQKVNCVKQVTHKKQIKNEAPIKDEKTYKKVVPNYKLADILMEEHTFAVIESNLYYWNQSLGYFVGLTGDKADIFIRQNIPDKYKNLISFKSCQEIIQWIKAREELKVNEEILLRRKSYVAFSNCIIDINTLSYHAHSPSYYFTSVINARYPLDKKPTGNTFEVFLNQITGGDKRIYKRIQELFGYVISEIRDVKAIPYLIGPKDSGKSVILKILEHLVGQDFFTNLSFEELNQPNFLCQLFGKKLNACGETSEIALNRLDNFKKLSGGDYVMARFLYGQAFKFINKSVLLFAGNHLPTIKGIDKSNAFSQRLVIFPFNHPVPKEKQDIHLYEKLLQEIEYIAQWALIGLKRWCKNNYQFTTCPDIEYIAKEYSEQTNSIANFISSCCFFDPDVRAHNDTLELAYKKYCRKLGITEESNKAFHKYMKTVNGLKYCRFRQNGENKFGYIGINIQDS